MTVLLAGLIVGGSTGAVRSGRSAWRAEEWKAAHCTWVAYSAHDAYFGTSIELAPGQFASSPVSTRVTGHLECS